MGEDESGVRSDPLITMLRQASKTGSIVQFVGYLDVSEDGVVRLFDNLSFESYVELRRADVIEFMEVPREGVNRHRVFLPGSANVRRVVGVNTARMLPAQVGVHQVADRVALSPGGTTVATIDLMKGRTSVRRRGALLRVSLTPESAISETGSIFSMILMTADLTG